MFAIEKVLIGCDGINSVVAKWLGFKEASFTGRYVIRGYKKLMNNHGLEPKFMLAFISFYIFPIIFNLASYFFKC